MKSQDFPISRWFSESSISADTEPISKFLDALERGDPNSFISGTFDNSGRCYHTTHLPFVRAILAKMSSRRPTIWTSTHGSIKIGEVKPPGSELMASHATTAIHRKHIIPERVGINCAWVWTVYT